MPRVARSGSYRKLAAYNPRIAHSGKIVKKIGLLFSNSAHMIKPKARITLMQMVKISISISGETKGAVINKRL